MSSTESPRARGYGITKSDMEASRLVFVFVKDSKPRRKVAVPVPDNYTWEEFLNQVKHKLRLSAVGNIYLASSGQQIQNLDELQDIDELCVEEAVAPAQPTASAPATMPTEAALRSGVAPTSSGDVGANGPSTPTMYRSQSDKHKVVMADSGSSSQRKEETSEQKYVKRSGSVRRALQRVFPGWLQPSLPVSTKDVGEDKAAGAEGRAAARRRRRRGGCSSRNLLLLLAACSCLATMVVLYMRVSAQG